MTRPVTDFGMMYSARRYNVIALAFVLCAWLITAAMHLHLQDQHAGGADPSPCGYCLALSAGAAPAPEHQVPSVILAPGIFVSFYETPVHEQAAPSSYLSRGPPAA